MLSALLMLAAGDVFGGERVIRHFGRSDGLPTEHVEALAQDDDGFLWIGTAGGLARYDGESIRPWDPQRRGILELVSCGDLLAARTYNFEIIEVVGPEVRAVAGPDGEPLEAAGHIACDAGGGLWVQASAQVHRRDADGAWSRPLLDAPVLEDLTWRVRPRTDGGLWLFYRHWLVAQSPSGSVQRFARLPDLIDVEESPDGAVWTLQRNGPVRRFVDGVETDVWWPYEGTRRLIDLTVRGETAWVSGGVGLFALRPGRPYEVIAQEQGIQSANPLLVDHEGSLWVGSFQGLNQLPEPDTVSYPMVTVDGEDTSHSRFLAQVGDRIIVSTWEYGAWFDAEGADPANAVSTDVRHKGNICVDRDGVGWTTGTDLEDVQVGHHFLALTDAGPRRYPLDDATSWGVQCGLSSEGRVWFATRQGVFRTPEGAGQPERITGPPPGAERAAIRAILEDSAGRLWVSARSRVCSAPVAEVLADAPDWRCARIDDPKQVTSLLETPAGAIWATGDASGLHRWDGSGWVPHPGSATFDSLWAQYMRLGADDTIWIFEGRPRRVRETGPESWEVVELPGEWEGVPADRPMDLLDAPDGTRWLGTNAGVVRVPASAVSPTFPVPSVRLSELRVDGEPLPTSGEALTLPRPGSRLSLRFAALSYRDPSLLRYRYRLGPDQPWSRPSERAAFDFVALPSGDYQLEVAASLNGETWTAAPARLRFEVPTPWWLRPGTLASLAALLTALAYLGYRLRLTMALQVEQLRTRVAMDLHDEMGSALGSIGMLAGLLQADFLPPEGRAETAGRIADTSKELADSVSGIVWSLRPGSTALPALVDWVTRRGRQVFPGMDGAADFALDLPASVPEVTLSLRTVRAVQLVAAEAMHNAHKHARATTVTLRLRPEGRRWRLTVADDGRGFEGGDRLSGTRVGLESMKTRADDIGAELIIDASDAGTSVSLCFPPRPPDEGGWRDLLPRLLG